MSAHSLRARVGSFYILYGHGRAHFACQLGSIAALGFNKLQKNITKPIGIDISGGCPSEVHHDVPHSLRARVGSLTAWAPLDLRGCALGTSDTHEKDTSSELASNAPTAPCRTYIHAIPRRLVPDPAVPYRTLPCRPILGRIGPRRFMPYRRGPHSAQCPGHTRPYCTVPYVCTGPDQTQPHRAHRTVPYRTVPQHTVHTCRTVPHRPCPCRVLPALNFPCRAVVYCAVPYRTGPDEQ